MAQIGTNYKLNVYGDTATDKFMDFIDFRLAIAGPQAGSNFVVISNALEELKQAIADTAAADTNTVYTFSIAAGATPDNQIITIKKKDAKEGDDKLVQVAQLEIPIPSLTDYATKTYVQQEIGKMTHLAFVPVDSKADLPTPGVLGTIYLVPVQNATAPNIHEEYMWIPDETKPDKGFYEVIGTTAVDLLPYAKIEYVDAELAKKVNRVTTAVENNVVIFGAAGEVKDSGFTIEKSVPSDADFNDTGATTFEGKNGITVAYTEADRKLVVGNKNVAAYPVVQGDGTVSGTSTVFTIKHDLGTQILGIQVKRGTGDFLAPIYLPHVKPVDDNNAEVYFPTAYFNGAADTYTIYLMGYTL